jgi:hypothetical protein
MLRGLMAGLAALTLCACGSVTGDGNRDRDLFCHVTLEFSGDAERAAFITTNAEALIAGAPSVTLWSHPVEAKTHLLAERDVCPSSNLDGAFGVTGIDAAASGRETISKAAFAAELSNENRGVVSWDSDSPRQCVVRARQESQDPWKFMGDLMYTGLRGGAVHGDGEQIFFSADEPCAIVQRVAHASAAQSDRGVSGLAFCANSSHRACGDRNDLGVGDAALENIDQFGHD